MATNNAIILSADPKGHFIEGKLAAGSTPLPGQVLVLLNTGEYQAWAGLADGNHDEVVVVLPDSLQGKTVTEAYGDGDHFFGYIPVPGDELNMLFETNVGVADDVAVADRMIVKIGGNLIVGAGTEQMLPFKALEAVNNATVNTLIAVRRT